MLLLFEKGIRSGMCNAVCKYVKANNKYMRNYDKTKESIFLVYVDANKLYGWNICEKLPINSVKWKTDLSLFTSDFIKNYDSQSDIGCIFYVGFTYPKELYELHKDLPFLPDEMEVNKVNKFVAIVDDKDNYVIQILALKQALNHGLIL